MHLSCFPACAWHAQCWLGQRSLIQALRCLLLLRLNELLVTSLSFTSAISYGNRHWLPSSTEFAGTSMEIVGQGACGKVGPFFHQCTGGTHHGKSYGFKWDQLHLWKIISSVAIEHHARVPGTDKPLVCTPFCKFSRCSQDWVSIFVLFWRQMLQQ